MENPFRWGIIGLGLIGGSIARRLAQQGLPVLGADCDPAVRAEAMASGVFEALLDPPALVAAADGVILATPVGSIEELLTTLPWRRGQFVLDTGSTKRRIVAAMGRLPEGVGAVGGHPMAGKERSGFGRTPRCSWASRSSWCRPPARRRRPRRGRRRWRAPWAPAPSGWTLRSTTGGWPG